MKKIELSKEEKNVIQQYFNHEFDLFTATDEQQKLTMSVIGKAKTLMAELDAYDELEDDLLVWFWNKYETQEEQ
jgi:hypothetical protein